MRILLLWIAIVSFLMNETLNAQKLIEHEKSTNEIRNAIKVSPSKDNLITVLPDISKNLTNGEVVVCTEKGNDGKYTLFYSSVSGGTSSEILAGEREMITKKMFKSVGGMKPGDWMGYDFTYTKDGKSIPMKAHIFPVTENIISVLVWPISGLSSDISFGMEMAKVAPPTSPVAAAPLISPGAPMQQVQAPLPAQPEAPPAPAAAATAEPAAAPAPAAPAEQAPPAVNAEAAAPAPAPTDPAAASASPTPTAEAAQPPAAAPDPAAASTPAAEPPAEGQAPVEQAPPPAEQAAAHVAAPTEGQAPAAA